MSSIAESLGTSREQAQLSAVLDTARSFGFEEPMTIAWVRSVRRLPVKAGLYVLGFATGEYYVGRSEDLRQRVFRHDNRHDDLTWVCFLFMPRAVDLGKKIAAAERRAIAEFHAQLDPLGIRTRGIDVPWTPLPTPLDELVSLDEQELWRGDPYSVLSDGSRPARHEDPKPIAQRFADLSSRDDWRDIQKVIARYTQTIIARPRATEARFWAVSCFPNADAAVRINVGWQTTFDVYVDASGVRFAFYVPISLIKRHFDFDQSADYPNVYDSLTVGSADGQEITLEQQPIGLTKGGPDQVLLVASDVDSAMAFLNLGESVAMLRQFALGLMQKGQVPVAASHCTLLADAMLDPAASSRVTHVSIARSEPEAMQHVIETPVATINERYLLIEKISAGGQGEVWRARDTSGQYYAVKVLAVPQRSAERQELAARFDDEVKAGRLIRGMHVCEMVEAGTLPALGALGLTRGAHYLVMEYVSGGTLADLYERTEEFQAEDLRSLCEAMVSALSAAHELDPPIAHRDIKPQNVLLPEGDVARAKLADFGISRQAGDTQLTATGTRIGTWPYMAPEQFVRSSSATPASDQYSLALLLWEFAMAEVPGATETEVGTLRVRKRGINLLPFEVGGRRKKHVERVFARALEPDPANRFESVRAFGRAIVEAGRTDRLWS